MKGCCSPQAIDQLLTRKGLKMSAQSVHHGLHQAAVQWVVIELCVCPVLSGPTAVGVVDIGVGGVDIGVDGVGGAVALTLMCHTLVVTTTSSSNNQKSCTSKGPLLHVPQSVANALRRKCCLVTASRHTMQHVSHRRFGHGL